MRRRRKKRKDRRNADKARRKCSLRIEGKTEKSRLRVTGQGGKVSRSMREAIARKWEKEPNGRKRDREAEGGRGVK